MSLLLLIYWIFTQILAIVESAPKLEQKVQDSIKADEIETSIHSKTIIDDSSSEGYLSVDLVMPNLRNDDKSEERTGFAGYVFDERICKHLGGRILCGYNRNKGEYVKNISIDIGNGCFMRNDRIECGYQLPFDSNSANLRAKATQRPTFESKISQHVTTDENFITTKSEISTKNVNDQLSPIALSIQIPVSVISELTTSKSEERRHKESEEIRTNDQEQSNPMTLPTELPVSEIPEPTLSEIKISDHKELEKSYYTAKQELIKQSHISVRSNTSSSPSTLIASVRYNNMLTSPTLTEYNTTQSSTSSPNTSEANSIIDKVKSIHSTVNEIANEVLLENDNKTVKTNEGFDSKNVESINKETVTETQTKTSCVQNDDRVVCYHYKTN